MVCLSVAGSIVAGGHWFVVERPQQEVLQAPENSDTCAGTCRMQATDCAEACPVNNLQAICVDACTNTYYDCTCRYCNLYC